MTMNTPRPRIFLCYTLSDSHKIPWIVEELSKEVPQLSQHQSYGEEEAATIDPAIEISPGESIRQYILQTMQKASAVVVVWTPASAGSSHVNYEIGIADALSKPIIFAMDKGAPELPRGLQRHQVVEIREES